MTLPDHVVCLSVDFDGLAIWLQLDPTLSPTRLARAEFAGRFGLPRMLDLFAEQGIRCTVFVPGHTVRMFPAVTRRALAEGHEIGHHGYLHRNPPGLTRQEERMEFELARQAYEEVLGIAPRGYRAPGGDLSQNSIELALEFGIDYDASSQGSDVGPYYARGADSFGPAGQIRFGEAVDVVEIPSLPSMIDVPQMEFLVNPPMPGLHAYEKITRMWCDELDWMLHNTSRGVLTLVLHPTTAPKGARMRVLTDFIRHARASGVGFATMSQVADDFRRREPFSGLHLMSAQLRGAEN